VLIKEEYVYFAEGNGQVERIAKEGERVSSFEEVARISLLNDTSGLKQELLEVDQKIDTLSKSDRQASDISNDNTQLEDFQKETVNDIQKYINEGSYLNVQRSKEEILIYNGKLNNSSQGNTLLNQSIETLKETRKGLVEKIDKNNIRCYSSESGLISYEIDGYENIFLPKDFENYTYENLNIDENAKNEIQDKISIGSPVFKTINNFEWYLAIKVTNTKDIEDYEIGQAITVEVADKEIIGNIVAINTTNNKAVIVVRFRDYLHEIYNLRFTDVSIIKEKIESYKIPVNAVFDYEGKKGVYIEEVNGIVKFKPVNVLDIVGDDAYIDKGDIGGFITIGGEKYKTVSLYDEIFIDPTTVKDGQILR
jgi:putative membrane fusion protein